MAKRSAANKLRAVKKFTLFPKLPKEIRLKVWQFAAREPRIVEVCQRQDPQYVTQGNDDNDYESSNSAPFYSPTALPILQATHEARVIALEHYILSFPNGEQPAQIYFNPAVDLLYFPAWCFQYNVTHFETVTLPEIKDTIRRIAIDNLIWYSGWEDGTINNQIHIDVFKNLEEFLLVTREPDESGGGCCHEFEGPEKGIPEFAELEDGSMDAGSKKYFEKGVEECEREFARIRLENPEWKSPKARFVRLKRDGVIV
jgi:hypothetical protein